jgi:Flp pilus assembly protein TadG
MLYRGQEGASAVEFALVLPILMLFVFGIIEFGLAYNRVQAFQAAAREAGRLSSVGIDVTVEPTLAHVRGIAGSTVNDSSAILVTVDRQCPARQNATNPTFVAAKVSLTEAAKNSGAYAVKIPLLQSVQPDFSAEAVFRCERR